MRADSCVNGSKGAHTRAKSVTLAGLLPLRLQILYPFRELSRKPEVANRCPERNVVPLRREYTNRPVPPELIRRRLINDRALLRDPSVQPIDIGSIKVENDPGAQRMLNHLRAELTMIVVTVKCLLNVAKDDTRALPNRAPPRASELNRAVGPASAELRCKTKYVHEVLEHLAHIFAVEIHLPVARQRNDAFSSLLFSVKLNRLAFECTKHVQPTGYDGWGVVRGSNDAHAIDLGFNPLWLQR